MKTSPLLLAALCLCAFEPHSQASTLYGSTSAGGVGELWIIDAATGNAVQDVGPLNDSSSANYAVTGLAFHPTTGVLYGSTGGKTGTLLLTINPTNALVTVVGSYGTAGTMADLAFDPSGHLYGISASGGANLYTINTATGTATKVGPSGVSFTEGGGLAISPAGVFFASPTHTQFGTYDPTTGVYSNITNPFKPAGATASYAAMAFDGNTLYGMDLGTPTHLVIFDAAGNVTDIGPSVLNIDGIAFTPKPSLNIQNATNSVALTWGTYFAGFHLQQNTAIGSTNWVNTSNSVTVVGTTNQVTVPIATNNLFFRLANP
ncbi:MAG: DUF6923 family protein [Limisphaerales bacterium]